MAIAINRKAATMSVRIRIERITRDRCTITIDNLLPTEAPGGMDDFMNYLMQCHANGQPCVLQFNGPLDIYDENGARFIPK